MPFSVVLFSLRWFPQMLPMPSHLSKVQLWFCTWSSCNNACLIRLFSFITWQRCATCAITSGLVISKSVRAPSKTQWVCFLWVEIWSSVCVNPLCLCCVSWTAWVDIRTQFGLSWWNGVARISWNSSHRHLGLWTTLCSVVFCTEIHHLLICRSTFFRFQSVMPQKTPIASSKAKKRVLPSYAGATFVVICWVMGIAGCWGALLIA